MIVAFSRGNAQDFDHNGQPLPQADNRRVLANAAALLKARNAQTAADLTEQFPFEIRQSGNIFSDDFNILYASVPLDAYEKAREFASTAQGKRDFRNLAEVVTELGHFIRFIALELSLAPAVARTPSEQARALTETEVDWVARYYIGVHQGYLGDFSYRTHREFYRDLDLDIIPEDYPGTTRARFERILLEATLPVQATILRGILRRYPVGTAEIRSESAAARLSSLIARVDGASPVAVPTPQMTTAVVERALADAEHLLGKTGATSAVDRMHTALHGYLLKVCSEAGIATIRTDSIAVLLRHLREQHPKFADHGSPRAADVGRILKGLASTLDAPNAIRNNASVAHPNEELLDTPEAMLAINAVRSVLHYVEARLNS
jgi:hypothetical protein